MYIRLILMNDDANHLEMLTKTGDSLVRLNQVIEWKIFRAILTEAMKSVTTRKANDNRGRPSFDAVTIFKILVLQRLYHLSDDSMQHALYDRVSFMRFTGFSYGDHMPDTKTIW